MPEYWEKVQQRAVDTCAVWNEHNAGFQVGQLTLAAHQADVDALAGLAEAASAAEDEYDAAVDARDSNLDWIAGVNVRAVGVLRGNLEGTGVLPEELIAVSGIVNKGMPRVLERARTLITVWSRVNAARASLAWPAVLVGMTGVGDLSAAVDGHEARLQAVTEKLSGWNMARAALVERAKRVDGNSKRWYTAWSGFYPAGSPENEAREQIETERPGARRKEVFAPPRPK